MVNGKDIFISLGTSASPIAATKSNEIQTECDLLEVSSPYTGTWKKSIPGRKQWGFTTSWLLASVNNITDLLNVGTTYTINVYARPSTKKLTGSAILKACKVTASVGNLVQGSFQFEGVSELAQPSA